MLFPVWERKLGPEIFGSS